MSNVHTDPPIRSLSRSDPEPPTIGADALLPVAPVEIQAVLAAVYHAAIGGASREESLQALCLQLARCLRVPLITVGRKCANGAVSLDAASCENTLWLEFRRVQERWDGGVASEGPAGCALRYGRPTILRIDDPGFAIWRTAAEHDGIQEILTLPIAVAGATYVLELCAPERPAVSDLSHAISLDQLTSAIASLLEDLERLEHQGLLADALACAGNATFITDAHGTIVWSNRAFSGVSGYTAEEVRGHNPSMLQSGKQGVRYYRELWSTIRSGRSWAGETVDRDKSGNLYTIRQTVSPVTRSGRLTHYVSIHDDITRQKREQGVAERSIGTDRATGLLMPAAFEAVAGDALATESVRHSGAELLVVSLRGLRKASPSFDLEMETFLTHTLGSRVREAIPEGHAAASMRPYEYAILLTFDRLPGMSADDVLKGLRERLDEPLLYLGDALNLDVCVGRAQFPKDGDSLEALLKHADRQLADEPVARVRHASTS